MKLPYVPLDGNDRETAGFRASRSLVVFLIEETKRVEDLYQNLAPSYDGSIYEKLEKQFTGLRNQFKGRLQHLSDPDYEFLNRSEMRRNFTEQILIQATAVAGQFQEAREKNHLDRVNCTDVLENLIYAMKNLSFLIEEHHESSF